VLNERTDPTTGGTPRPANEIVSLASILNIFWRRRLIILLLTVAGLAAGIVYVAITEPLYRAVGTVRPGITSYSEAGNPQRTWQLKDIVRWYRRGLYGDGVKQRLGFPPESYRPDITAEFIPRGVGIQGGNVVTLTTLSTTREQAEQILTASIETFNRYAEINSVGNDLSLSRHELEHEIDKLKHDRDDIDIKRDLLELRIGRKGDELKGIAIEQQRLELAAKEHLARQGLRDAKAGILESGVDSTRSGLQDMAYYLERMRAKEARQGDLDSTLSDVPSTDRLPFLWWELAQDKTAMAGRMLANSLEMQSAMWEDQLEATELRHANEIQEFEHEGELLQQNFDLAFRKAILESEIREMEINRDRALSQELIEIEDQIRVHRSRLELLTPLESIGTIFVTDNPVRPRKQRAMGLLTLMGFLGSLALAPVWEYVSQNRREIFTNGR